MRALDKLVSLAPPHKGKKWIPAHVRVEGGKLIQVKGYWASYEAAQSPVLVETQYGMQTKPLAEVHPGATVATPSEPDSGMPTTTGG